MILTLHLIATFYLVGLIWFVQIVHYPLFDGVDPTGFRDYERRHVNRTGPVVAPVMLIELVTGLLLAFKPVAAFPAPWTWVGLGLLGILWASTFLIQVPQHSVLSQGFHVRAHSRLVWTNWFRTISWSLRGLLLGWILLRVLEPS